MQNIDFYNGHCLKNVPYQFDSPDPEFLPRMSKIHTREEEKLKKKASRMIFFITALCIISFTSGMVIGIKFAGGQNKEILDRETYNAVTGLGKKVTNLVQDNGRAPVKSAKNIFPAKEYPFVIRLDMNLDQSRAQEIAAFLSAKGHTVIVSKNNESYRIYLGPYKSLDDAKNSLNKIAEYPKYSFSGSARIIQR